MPVDDRPFRASSSHASLFPHHLLIESLFDICFSLWLGIYDADNSVIIQSFMYLFKSQASGRGVSESTDQNRQQERRVGIRNIATSPILDPGSEGRVAIATVLSPNDLIE